MITKMIGGEKKQKEGTSLEEKEGIGGRRGRGKDEMANQT